MLSLGGRGVVTLNDVNPPMHICVHVYGTSSTLGWSCARSDIHAYVPVKSLGEGLFETKVAMLLLLRGALRS